MGLVSGIPKGMCRVVEVFFDGSDEKLIGDFPTDVAIQKADDHNRSWTSPMDSAFWVYDHFGGRIRTQDSLVA